MKPGQIQINQVHQPPPQQPNAAVAAYLREALMACRNCGQTMKRGTQCLRCGAWCR